MAEAGVNNEFSYIGTNVGSAADSALASPPVVYPGVTDELPGATTPVVGRPGTVGTGTVGVGNVLFGSAMALGPSTGIAAVSSNAHGKFYVYSSNDSNGAAVWDGATSPFYVTASAKVGNCWHTVQVTSETSTAFNVYGIFALGSYASSSSSAITVSPAATVTVGQHPESTAPFHEGSRRRFRHQNAVSATQRPIQAANSPPATWLPVEP